MSPPLPTPKEVEHWLFHTCCHSLSIEYFLHHLDINPHPEKERPHDLAGPYNKLDWRVIKGLALSWRNPLNEEEQALIGQSIYLHRKQHHHQVWNGHRQHAQEEDLLCGAVDTVQCLLENRPYQQGAQDYSQIPLLIDQAHRHQLDHILKVIPRMWALEPPNLEQIISLTDFPNIGLPEPIYQKTRQRMQTALAELRTKGYKLRTKGYNI